MLAAIAFIVGFSQIVGSVRGDFDRDGKPDVVTARPGSKGTIELVVQRDAAGPPTVITTYVPNGKPDFILDRAKPGLLKTWCGKGGDDGEASCPRTSVRLVGDTFGFGVAEASYSVVIWTGAQFETVLISD